MKKFFFRGSFIRFRENKICFFLMCALWLCNPYISNCQNHPTGLKELKPGTPDYKYSQSIPAFKVKHKSLKTEEVITSIDNSKSKFFPPIIKQHGSACAFAVGVGYIYNYNLNRIKGIESSSENTLNYMYIYALCNNGEDLGGNIWDSWNAVRDNGAPYNKDYSSSKIYEWMNGSSKYINGMGNRVKGIYKIDLFPEGEFSQSNFNDAKEYLADGGVLQFSTFIGSSKGYIYDGPSITGYKTIISEFGDTEMHSMTVVGYDDDVEWDYNDDGNISSDEKGAFIVVNIWGEEWADKGRFYAPYKTFIDFKQGEGGTGNAEKAFYLVEPVVNDVKYVMKIKLNHSSRNDIKFKVGFSSNSSSDIPAVDREMKIMNHAGGDKNISGTSSDMPIEIAFDVSDLVTNVININKSKFFLEICDEVENEEGEGQLIECSLIDTKNNHEFLGKIKNSEITNGHSAIAEISVNKPQVSEGENTVSYYQIKDNILSVSFVSVNDSYAKILVKDETAKVIKTLLNGKVDKGSYIKKYDLNELPKGDLYLSINADNEFIIEKITIK